MVNVSPQVLICEKCGHKNPLRPRFTFKTTKMGKRADLGEIMWRSGWEANYARYLNLLQQEGKVERWYYESKRFSFPVATGARSYLPDFCVVWSDGRTEYHEVKGFWTKRAKTMVKRFKKFYPEETLVIIEKKEYNKIKGEYSGKIPEWEMEKSDQRKKQPE